MKRTQTIVTIGLGIAVGLACLDSAMAHGGRYRGPKDPIPQARPPQARAPQAARQPGAITRRLGSAPVPVAPTGGPAAAGPITPGGIPSESAVDLTRWQGWWEMNRDRYLFVKKLTKASPGPITGGDQFFLGARRRVVGASTKLSVYQSMADQVLPALHQALVDASDPNIVSACLIGMAKIGRDTKTIKLREVFTSYLSGRYQEVRETAALALGISRQAEALPILREVLLDTAAGRHLCKRSEVDYRVRAFAAYGLGILAANGDSDVCRRAFEVLQQTLTKEDVSNRDIRVAVVTAIGGLDLKADRNIKDKRLLWQALPVLQGFYDEDLGKGEQIAQAHVPIAIARLLGRGDSPDQKRYQDFFLSELFAKKKRQNSIYQSAAIALGLITPKTNKEVSDGLHRYFEKGRDQQTRYFCLIAMGEIGGDTNRSRLLTVLARGRKSLDRPWAALALGVLSHKTRSAQSGKVDLTIGTALLRQLTLVKNREAVGAFAIGLGLCGHLDASKSMQKQLKDHPHHDGMAGSLCTGLALMGDQSSTDLIRQVLHRSIRRPALLRQVAIALGKLKDRNATHQLMEMLSADNKNTARMAALAGALQFIGDRRTVEALLGLLKDDELTSLSRAFVAAALGGIADPMRLPFNERYARHSNYRAVVETLSNQLTGILDLL